MTLPAPSPDRTAPHSASSSRAAWSFCGPAVLWLILLVGLPMARLATVSFLSRDDLGQVQGPFTLENYRRLAGWSELGFDPLYPQVLLRTLLVAAGVTVLCLGSALPLAFFISRLSPRGRRLALALVLIPLGTNLLIRTYAWQILLGNAGPIAAVATALGWIPPDAALYPGWLAVILALWSDFLPIAVLPIYASAEKLDPSLAEAAADLGASRWPVFRHAILPQIRPGMAAGAVLVFLPVTGQFVIPDLLGGGRTAMLGNLIQQQFGGSRDWPFGASAAVVALALLGMALFLQRRRTPGMPTP